MTRPARTKAWAITAKGGDNVTRYLRFVDEQVEWGDIGAAHQFDGMKEAITMLVGLSLDHQPRFDITEFYTDL